MQEISLAPERLGKFTASRISELLVNNKQKTGMGQTAFTYIKQKACEHLTGRQKESFSSMATDWGNAWEFTAVQTYDRRNLSESEFFGSTNPKFFPCPGFEEYAGGSPDFKNWHKIKIVGEAKCPFNSDVHLTNLNITTQAEFKQEYADYYSQIQFNILCTGSEIGHFISYDWRFLDESKQLKILVVEKDQEHLDLILNRLSTAVDALKDMIG